MPPSRYMISADEAELFEFGATSWRMDVATYRSLRDQLRNVSWTRPDDMPDDLPGWSSQTPLGSVCTEVHTEVLRSFTLMLNDPVLFPGLTQMGTLQATGLEIQNGSFDDAWHHDGLAGKRMGHAGDFFAIAYFGETAWDKSWGGYFEYGRRRLHEGWPHSRFTPEGETRCILPADRTVLLGWNQNPCLVHRAAPLTEAKDRITLIASVDLVSR